MMESPRCSRRCRRARLFSRSLRAGRWSRSSRPENVSRAEAIEAERESAFENGASSMRDAAANLLSLRADACRSTAESRTAFDDRAPIERYAANELSRTAFDVRRITLKM